MNWKLILPALTAGITASFAATPVTAQDQGRVITGERAVLDYRERPAVENALVAERLENLLPQLMDETDIDMWLIINREYAEDPIYFTLVPQPSFAARRTTMIIFHRHDGVLDKLTVNRYPLGDPYESAWEGGALDEQWEALGALIAEKNPTRIGVNVSRDWPVADGMTHGIHERLMAVLSPELQARIVSAEDLVVRWTETRSEHETEIYSHVVGLARQVIGEAFSSRVITPGVTTTDDVAWYLRQRFEDLNLPPWFMPYVNVQRPGVPCAEDQAFCGITGVIHRGDVIHTDVGICYFKVCTDTQEMGYIAHIGEDDVPRGLKSALRVGNRWQDDLTSSFETGLTGNEILANTRAKCDRRNVNCSVYTHPIGFFGHAPGPTIGMWDNQGETPIRGDWPLYANTCYAIEGNIKAPVSEWDGQLVQIKLEQSACYDGEKVNYLAGRQTQWHIIQ